MPIALKTIDEAHAAPVQGILKRSVLDEFRFVLIAAEIGHGFKARSPGRIARDQSRLLPERYPTPRRRLARKPVLHHGHVGQRRRGPVRLHNHGETTVDAHAGRGIVPMKDAHFAVNGPVDQHRFKRAVGGAQPRPCQQSPAVQTAHYPFRTLFRDEGLRIPDKFRPVPAKMFSSDDKVHLPPLVGSHPCIHSLHRTPFRALAEASEMSPSPYPLCHEDNGIGLLACLFAQTGFGKKERSLSPNFPTSPFLL